MENQNRLVSCKEIESVIFKTATNKSPRPDGFTDEFHQAFKEVLVSSPSQALL